MFFYDEEISTGIYGRGRCVSVSRQKLWGKIKSYLAPFPFSRNSCTLGRSKGRAVPVLEVLHHLGVPLPLLLGVVLGQLQTEGRCGLQVMFFWEHVRLPGGKWASLRSRSPSGRFGSQASVSGRQTSGGWTGPRTEGILCTWSVCAMIYFCDYYIYKRRVFACQTIEPLVMICGTPTTGEGLCANKGRPLLKWVVFYMGIAR